VVNWRFVRAGSVIVGQVVGPTKAAHTHALGACPNCESVKNLPMLYGLLAAESEALVLDGKAVSGGCWIAPGMPRRSCSDCGHAW
jgi:hypothetical protein